MIGEPSLRKEVRQMTGCILSCETRHDVCWGEDMFREYRQRLEKRLERCAVQRVSFASWQEIGKMCRPESIDCVLTRDWKDVPFRENRLRLDKLSERCAVGRPDPYRMYRGQTCVDDHRGGSLPLHSYGVYVGRLSSVTQRQTTRSSSIKIPQICLWRSAARSWPIYDNLEVCYQRTHALLLFCRVVGVEEQTDMGKWIFVLVVVFVLTTQILTYTKCVFWIVQQV